MATACNDIAAMIPPAFAIAESVVPVREVGDTLVVAISRKPSSDLEGRLQFILNRNVRIVYRSADWLTAKLREFYDHPNTSTANSGEDDKVTWYWPGWHCRTGATLVVKASGWSNGVHWTGEATFPPEHEDYGFWLWLIAIPQHTRLVDETEIPSIKRIWNRYRLRTRK